MNKFIINKNLLKTTRQIFCCKKNLTTTTTTTTHNGDSSFEGYLHAKIKLKGPITVANYMKEALTNPKWGYYMNRDVFGTKGDFTTAPEVSQMFGEMIGVWFLNEWLVLKGIYGDHLPPKIQLVELGPGRGTLMKDILRIWNRRKEITSAVDLNVYMIEASSFMRKTQFKNLIDSPGHDKQPVVLYKPYQMANSKTKVTWLSDINELPVDEAVHFFLANEFFDALPIHKFQKTPKGYREVLIDFDDKSKKFKFVLSPLLTVGSQIILKLKEDYSKYEHVEVSAESARYVEAISKKLYDYNGSALIIDYGHDGLCKDTFRGFKDHKLIDVFEQPGKCDLTVDVDFAFLKQIAKKSQVMVYGPATQGGFLSQMQIGQRLQMLLKNCKTEKERTNLINDFNMLIKPDKMGERFKLMSMRKFDFKQCPAGFADTKLV